MKPNIASTSQGQALLKSPPALTLKQVGKSLGGSSLFSDVNLSLGKGETLAIVGESGSGKSTLLHVMAGLDTPDQGDVVWNDTPLHGLSPNELARFRLNHVGLVFQAYYLMPHLDAVNNVQLPFLLAGIQPDTARCMALLEHVGMAHKCRSLPREMSGGEQQRVAIARALALHPPLILADEPTGNLDEDNADRVLNVLLNCCKTLGSALVMVTHSGKAASHLDQRVDLGQHRVQQHQPTSP